MLIKLVLILDLAPPETLHVLGLLQAGVVQLLHAPVECLRTKAVFVHKLHLLRDVVAALLVVAPVMALSQALSLTNEVRRVPSALQKISIVILSRFEFFAKQ